MEEHLQQQGNEIKQLKDELKKIKKMLNPLQLW